MLFNILIIIVILFALIYFNNYKIESFTVYQLNYRTDIEPKWNERGFPSREYRRCICSSDGDCRCMFDSDDIMLQYYFD